MATTRISDIRLLVTSAEGLYEFYHDLLGMRGHHPLPGTAVTSFSFGAGQASLSFLEGAASAYQPAPHDLYWKVGITLKNLDHAVDYLRAAGCTVSEPRQFRDIGYLAHIKDPQGFSIELLQQGFEGNEEYPGPGHPIAGQATLAHLTLRVTDLAAARLFCEKQLGMRLFSIQPVPPRDFSLYFYAWGDEALPDPNLEAVANREWLWARPYTLLELQHLETVYSLSPVAAGSARFAGFNFLHGEGQDLFIGADELSFFG